MLNLATLNPEQRAAVETVEGPVLILAGAGTGKTRVITFRIAHLVQRKVSPENILAVTFTNKAAREMQERVSTLLPPREKNQRPTICTFHSLCVRILRQHIERLGYKKNFVIYDGSEQLAVIKKILSRFSKSEKVDPAAILSLLSKFKNANKNSNLLTDPNLRAMLEHVRSHYETALRACNAVDFDDLILLALKLFQEHPAALEACRAKYRYVMVDEYQDTNGSQFQLVHSITEKHRNLCVVGDDDQSIYGWRGAEVANLLELEKYFPEVKVVKLEQNYRSTTTILSAANAVIRNNPRRRGKQLWSQKGTGEKITIHAFQDDTEEARTIVEEIEYGRTIGRVPWSDQAILFRTNIQSRALETALRQGGVRYHLIGGQSYFDSREVRDFLAYLKVFLNPHDDISLLRIGNVPSRGLSDVTMERLLAASQERHCSVYTVLKHTDVIGSFQPRTRESLSQFAQLLDEQHEMLQDPTRPLGSWAEKFLTETGYLADLRRVDKNIETAENRIRNLKDLVATMDEQAGSAGSAAERLQTFLEEIALDSEREEEKEKSGEAVTLITMHSCKGLEFPHVYVVGLEDGLLPHSRSKVEGTLDEERRLFYVAITRAMRTLTLSHCGGRLRYGQLMPCHPSPFLKELPEHLIVPGDEKGKAPVKVEAGKSLFDGMRASLE